MTPAGLAFEQPPGLYAVILKTLIPKINYKIPHRSKPGN